MADVQPPLLADTRYAEKYTQHQIHSDPSFLTNLTARPPLNTSLTVNNLQPSPNQDLLITSPYTTASHLLNIATLDTPNRLMALALCTLSATTPAYASTPYLSSFNWPQVLANLRHLSHINNHTWTEQTFYCVVFNSQLRPSCHYPDLAALDELAHEEAMAGGPECDGDSGFLKYWFGEPDAEGRNLATCIWRSKADARKGSGGPMHRRAAMAARPSYEWFGIQGLRFVVGDGADDFRFETWID